MWKRWTEIDHQNKSSNTRRQEKRIERTAEKKNRWAHRISTQQIGRVCLHVKMAKKTPEVIYGQKL